MYLNDRVIPLQRTKDLAPLIQFTREKARKCVFIGEASHGTSEYYNVKGYDSSASSARDVLKHFERWPISLEPPDTYPWGI